MTDEQRPDDAAQEPSSAPAEDDEPRDIEGWRGRVATEQEKAQSYYASWQRAAADYQNLKRRMEQERSEVGRLANAALVINLLPLFDDLERALRTVDSNLAGLTWINGLWLIYRKFEAFLESIGVKEIAADGQAFDPNLHEAISQAPGDEGKIVSVVQKGYTLGDRVVRPAMVVVGGGTGNKEPGTGAVDTQEDVPG